MRKLNEIERESYKLPCCMIKKAMLDSKNYNDFCVKVAAYLVILMNNVKDFDHKDKCNYSFVYKATISNNQITTQLLRVPNRVPEGITARIRNSITWLIENKFLKCDNDFEKVKNSNCCEYDVTSNVLLKEFDYISIFLDEVKRIFHYCKDNNYNMIRAIGFLVLFRSGRIYNRSKKFAFLSEKEKSNEFTVLEETHILYGEYILGRFAFVEYSTRDISLGIIKEGKEYYSLELQEIEKEIQESSNCRKNWNGIVDEKEFKWFF